MAYLFIAHDLALVESICDKVAVMYLGRIMETGPATAVYSSRTHPYTEALMSASPAPDPFTKKSRIILKGDTPSPVNLPEGCVFHARCPLSVEDCSRITPPLTRRGPDHYCACIVR